MKKLILATMISAITLTAQANAQTDYRDPRNNVLCIHDEMEVAAETVVMQMELGFEMHELYEEEEWAPGLHESMREMVQDAYTLQPNLRPGLRSIQSQTFVEKWVNYCEQ